MVRTARVRSFDLWRNPYMELLLGVRHAMWRSRLTHGDYFIKESISGQRDLCDMCFSRVAVDFLTLDEKRTMWFSIKKKKKKFTKLFSPPQLKPHAQKFQSVSKNRNIKEYGGLIVFLSNLMLNYTTIILGKISNKKVNDDFK